jgi:hypothetical protein
VDFVARKALVDHLEDITRLGGFFLRALRPV